MIYALRIEVVDAASLEPICDAKVTIEIDGHAERRPASCHYAGGTRSGSYRVTVERDGYETKVISDVTVHEGDCHAVEPRNLEIHLQPAAS